MENNNGNNGTNAGAVMLIMGLVCGLAALLLWQISCSGLI